MHDRERPALVTLALLSAVLPGVPLLGLEHIVFTRPVLAGLLVWWFVRRFALRRIDAVVAAVAPVMILTTIGVVRDGGNSTGYRTIVWLAVGGLYLVATSAGAAAARWQQP